MWFLLIHLLNYIYILPRLFVSNFVKIEQPPGNQMIHILVYFEIFILHRFWSMWTK